VDTGGVLVADGDGAGTAGPGRMFIDAVAGALDGAWFEVS
jgi:hypothetical protein